MFGIRNVKNIHGFTLLESLFQLVIMSIFLHFFILFFYWKEPIEKHYSDYKSTEWELFCIDVQFLLSDIQNIELDEYRRIIRIANQLEMIEISQSQTVIRKRVDNNGHIPLLTGIRFMDFTFDGMMLSMHVSMLDGSVKERRFAVGIYPE